ncbi:MAG: flagellin [Magnetospirillum sp.]|nr:flagellin [Magnetospirillum sp.]
MSNSVDTNIGAYTALASLRTTQSALNVASKKAQTGYRVAEAADGASAFSVSQGISGNLQAYSSIQASLTSGVGIGTITQAALTNISNTIRNLQARIMQLGDGFISTNQRSIYTADFNTLTTQVADFISQASYNGTNLISAGSTAKAFLADNNGTALTMTAQSSVDAAFNAFASTANIVATASDAAAGLNSLSTFQQAVATSLGINAAETRTFTLQSRFINAIVDSTSIGFGAIVDTDIGKVSAIVQAQQVRQQLGIQSLSIANQQPSVLLNLLR